jgi:hypothetical protein
VVRIKHYGAARGVVKRAKEGERLEKSEKKGEVQTKP